MLRYLLLVLSFHSHALELVGRNISSGEACRLEVVNSQSTGAELGWDQIQLLVKTSEQLPQAEPILIKQSFTLYTLFGKSTVNRDQINVVFDAAEIPSLSQIRSYTFQTWDEGRGLVQAHCRF